MSKKQQTALPEQKNNINQEVIKKQDAVEKRLIGELFMANNTNDLLGFTQVYITHYLPLFAYAVKHCKTNEIASMLNTSILIDHILYTKMNKIIKCQVESDINEFIRDREIPKSSVIHLLKRQTSLSKAALSSQLLFMFSFTRSALFSIYCDRKLYLNYGIGWSNMFMHFVSNPHLSFMLDEEILDRAEQELSFIENDLKDENGKLEEEVNEMLVAIKLPEEEAKRVPKHFVGLKLDWLKSKSLLSYCRFLKTNNKKHMRNAIRYSQILVETLSSHDNNYHSLSFRDKISFPGPSPYIKTIIGEIDDYSHIVRLFNYIAYFENNDNKYVLVFPTNLDFYLSDQSTLPGKDQALLDDENFLLNCHEKGCFAFLDLLNIIRTPDDTAFYHRWMEVHRTFMTYEKYGLSEAFLHEQLSHSASADIIAKEFEKKTDRTKLFMNTIGVTIICGIDHYAEARGFFAIPSYVSVTIPLITEIIIKTIYCSGYDSLMLKLMSANDSTNSSEDDIDEYESIQEIEESLGCIDSDLGDMLDMINSDVLKDINEISHEIRQLIKSTKSIDEINNRLGEISSCIEGAGSLEAIDEG